MRRLRRSIGIGAALSFLLLGAPVDGAGAATEDPPSMEPPARVRASEPTGRAASVNAMRSGRLQCGDTITRNTTLTVDVGPCAADGIIIGADNITLNLNGRTVSGTPGPGNGNHAGIRLTDRNGVTVTGLPGASGKKGTVTGFDAGILINRGAGNTVENVAAQDNVGPQSAQLGDGIAIFESANNRILNNTVLRNGVYDGIAVLGLGADNNLIQGNLIADNPLREEFRMGGQGIVISNVLDVNTSLPIRGNKVVGNTIRNNPTSGISTIANVEGYIAGNTVEGNGYRFHGVFEFEPGMGIGVQGGPGLADSNIRALVENNVTNDNGIAGIIVYGNSDSNVVRQNQSFRNGLVGIVLSANTRDPSQAPDNNSVLNNDTGYNGLVDLYGATEDCGTNTWFGNTWGPLSPLAAEWGLTTMYYPDCTATGGSLQTDAPAEG